VSPLLATQISVAFAIPSVVLSKREPGLEKKSREGELQKAV
jgi:hypothetical protein